MKKLILILLIWTTTASAQLLRFATLYTSYSTSAPFVEKQDFLVSGVENFGGAGSLSEVTRANPPGINLTFGLRKIARFDYQVKQNQFYTGQENEVSDYATISNASGLEYLLEFSRVRNREIIFSQHEYRLRYISDNFTSRASYVDNNIVSLQYSDEKDVISIVSKALKTKVNVKSNSKNTEEWDSLGQLSILSAIDKATKGKSSKIDLTEVQSIKQLCVKLKKLK